MVKLVTTFKYALLSLLYLYSHNWLHVMAQSPKAGSTRFYDFKVQLLEVNKLCNTRNIVTINQKYPGPVVYAQEDDRVIVKLTNESPYNATIHWHGVRQILSCWSDGPSYITQCPVQPGQSFTYNFTLAGQKGTLFWHAHFSWLRATVYGALIVYPKKGVPYPFKQPYEEHIVILGEYWQQDLVQLEKTVMASGTAAPIADAYTINGHPGPKYNCSANDVYKIDVLPGKTYMLRLIGALLNMESFFSIANHKLTIVEADGEYTKPFTTDQVMLGPGQTLNVLVTADQPIGRYSMAMGPYMSAQHVAFQNITSIAYFQYLGATQNSVVLPASLLPRFNDNLAVKTVMDGLKSLETGNVPKEIDTNLFFTVGMNVNKCGSRTPKQNCLGVNGGVMAASMNNNSFIRPDTPILQAYYDHTNGHFTEDFPGTPLKFYDFVNGAPNSPPNNTGSTHGTRTKVLEYGSRVQLILQDTGTVTTENHPIHLHGYSFYVVGYGSGNYNPQTASFNLVDPPYMNTIGVPVGGWAAIRFIADNPGVWIMHCHLELHFDWGLSVAFIVKNGQGPTETLPNPPPDMPRC
ncbi:putative laccase [Helianthus annuus]|uniref:Laccase n=1 Tax=Helianthus annuus TaxID=4232 RepID=A0A9K3DU49_HELAN|nr:laccase-6 [Helianthus annuus]KAF5761587.1 putative laccase [Helianthus annuus]KAJ0444493.1 putative laccase [Helianthus annuus]